MAQTNVETKTRDGRSQKDPKEVPDPHRYLRMALPMLFTGMKWSFRDRLNGKPLNVTLKLTFMEVEWKETEAERERRREAYIARGLKRAQQQEADRYFSSYQYDVVARNFQEDAARSGQSLPPPRSIEWHRELTKYRAALVESHQMPTLAQYRRSQSYIEAMDPINLVGKPKIRERLGQEFDRRERSRSPKTVVTDRLHVEYGEPPARRKTLRPNHGGKDRRWDGGNHHTVRTGKIIFPMNTRTWEREPKPLRRKYPHNKLAHKEQPGMHQRRINKLEAERDRQVLLTQNRDDTTEAWWDSYEMAYRHMSDGLTRMSWLHLARADWFTRDAWEEDDYDYSDYSDDDPEILGFVWREEIAEREAQNADMTGSRVEAFYPPRWNGTYDPYLYLDRADY